MNLINAFLLSLFLRPAGMYKRLGVDVTKLKSLLTCKLIMDDRHPMSFGRNRRNKTYEPVNNTTWFALAAYTVMGGVCLVFFFIGNSPVLHYTVFFSMYLVLLTLSLIVDFTRVLIDVRDNFIILPKPVNDRTFLLARILHIAIHISKMAIPLFLPSAILTLIRSGPGGLAAFMLVTVLATVFSIFIINATYLAILRFSKPEKFKSIISYLQIAFTILVYGSYQILPRLIEKGALGNLDLNTLSWINIVPSYWFSALWKLLTNFEWNANLIIGSLLALLMPITGLWLVVKVFAPSFNQKLTLISGSSDDASTVITQIKLNPTWGQKISDIITTPGLEKMGFDLSWIMMLRSRDFKMQVYPGIGYLVVLLVVFVLKSGGIHASTFLISNTTNRFSILAVLYSPSLLMLAALAQSQFSPSWKAAWIYKLSPVEKPGKIICGNIKGIFAMFMLLPFILIVIFGIALNGTAILPAWIMAVCIQLMMIYLLSLINIGKLPFSQPMSESGGHDGSTIAKSILAMACIAIMVFLHWLVFSLTWLNLAIAATAFGITFILNKQIGNTGWNKINFAKDLS